MLQKNLNQWPIILGLVIVACGSLGALFTRFHADMGLLLIISAFVYALLFLLTKSTLFHSPSSFLQRGIVLIISAVIAVGSFYYCAEGMQSSDTTKRIGVEQVLDTSWQNSVTFIKEWQRQFLPDRQQNDVVPEHLQTNAGTFKTDVYYLNKPAEKQTVSQWILWGKMYDVKIMPLASFNILVASIILFIGLLCVLDRKFSTRWIIIGAISLISLLSIIISLRISHGWDEFFINLRHAFMWYEHSVYSINKNSIIEGTVDFLPLFITTLLGFIGIELYTGFVLTSLLGNVFVVIFTYLIVKNITQNRTWALLSALIAGLYPSVIYVGGTGFSAVLFTGWILAACYFMLFSKKQGWGLAFLATLTLLRTEGILFAALLMAYCYVIKPLPEIIRTKQWKQPIKNALQYGLIVALPFLLSLLIRYMWFGHAIPNPISFKNTHFDTHFFAAGLDRLSSIISLYDLHLLVFFILLLLIPNIIAWRSNPQLSQWKEKIKILLALNIVALLFILPYFSGGGDWFLNIWNRYGMSLNIMLLITSLILFYGAFAHALPQKINKISLAVFCIILASHYFLSIKDREDNYIMATYKSITHSGEHWVRINTFASVGKFLDKMLPADAVVASPEEATIMYFSEREMLGLLGVSNPDITTMPFQPLNPGDILHRKRGYASVYKNRPDIIVLYEPYSDGNFADQANLHENIQFTLQNNLFNPSMVNFSYYRVGSYDALQKMGYQHITITYTDKMYSFFIHKNIYDLFVQNLQANGFEMIGTHDIQYSVDPAITKKYVPAVPEIMHNL